jgi:hypothetical protein
VRVPGAADGSMNGETAGTARASRWWSEYAPAGPSEDGASRRRRADVGAPGVYSQSLICMTGERITGSVLVGGVPEPATGERAGGSVMTCSGRHGERAGGSVVAGG